MVRVIANDQLRLRMSSPVASLGERLEQDGPSAEADSTVAASAEELEVESIEHEKAVRRPCLSADYTWSFQVSHTILANSPRDHGESHQVLEKRHS